MKAFLTILLFLFSTTAFALDACYTGSWFDPLRDGEGINIEANDQNVVAYFYTFDRNDRKAWFTLIGDRVLAIFDTILIDDKYLDFRTETVLVGSAIIEPLTNNDLYFQYQFDLEYKNGIKYECVGDICTGNYLYRRLTQPIPCR